MIIPSISVCSVESVWNCAKCESVRSVEMEGVKLVVCPVKGVCMVKLVAGEVRVSGLMSRWWCAVMSGGSINLREGWWV